MFSLHNSNYFRHYAAQFYNEQKYMDLRMIVFIWILVYSLSSLELLTLLNSMAVFHDILSLNVRDAKKRRELFRWLNKFNNGMESVIFL